MYDTALAASKVMQGWFAEDTRNLTDAQTNATFLASAAAAATSQANVCLKTKDLQVLRQQVDDAFNLALADTTALQMAKLQLTASQANDAANRAQRKYDDQVKVCAAASEAATKAVAHAQNADQLAAQAAMAVQVSSDALLQLNTAFQAATAITDQANADAALAEELLANATEVAQLALAFADNVPPGFADPYIQQQMAVLEAQSQAHDMSVNMASSLNGTGPFSINSSSASAINAATY